MKLCPVCKQRDVGTAEIEKGLHGFKCFKCGGVWLPSNEYLAWKRTQQIADSATAIVVADIESADVDVSSVMDSQQVLQCPDCGRILRRYQIAQDIEFTVDRCSSCNGVWLDPNEWLLLKMHELHLHMNEFFTQPWQDRVRAEATRKRLQEIYQDRLGADDYAEISRIRTWLNTHPQQSRLMAYIMDQDPYTM